MTTTGLFQRSLWSSSSARSSHILTLSSHHLPPSHPILTPAVYHPSHRTFDETYDLYDPSTLTTPSQQRQQQAAPRPAPNPTTRSPISPPRAQQSSPRVIRRTSRYSPRRPGSVDASGRPFHIEQTIPVLVRPAPEPQPDDDDDENSDSALDENPQISGESYWPRRSTRVSSRTASAILWALEEAIRKPVPFTPDWQEVNASMSDLGGAPGSAALAGNGRSQNGASRAAHGPIPVNPHPPSGVRTPTDIMRQRRDREARRKAEQEAKDREQDEVGRTLQQEHAPAQPYPAGAAGDRSSQRRAAPKGPPAPERTATGAPITSPTSPRRPDPQFQPQIPTGAAAQGQQRPPTTSAPLQPGSTVPKPSVPQTQVPSSGSQQATSQPQQQQQQQQPRRVGFPHAFERWETLSSHWEGLTGYWIRKLELNNEALERDPLSQQMARQVTDLSAAGANLFHAVVELQRLRASSERKFQRWFFDTRAEQERAKELQASLELQVQTERQARSEAVTSLQKSETDKARIEELLKEMRRELQISKDEARRAWEELGRREQEERDRTNSLRNGEPTLVGGVQVVPMIPGPPGRRDPARPPTRDGPFPGGDHRASMGATPDHLYGETPASPAGTDPFTEGSQAQPSTSTASHTPAQYAGQYYEQEGTHPAQTTAERREEPSHGPGLGSSEPGEEDYGSYAHNSQGRQIVYPRPMSEESDEYEQGSVEEGEHRYATSTMPPSSAPLYVGYDQGAVDYSGSGWGVGAGWESLTPRHRHPTRLSDVLEEEEPRTTPSRASRASQASRSVH
ncbi:hypothetical protein ARAM_002609 [Aspergillus rambellii]|uniref:Uncharacterized protein n=1 Tax=Aspergillus rambellii TaxID=308745 RepID=A0A0F8WAS4_9EURO|nr:hypothetical protein ARAM_002609 [Aspergillus rambellii]